MGESELWYVSTVELLIPTRIVTNKRQPMCSDKSHIPRDFDLYFLTIKFIVTSVFWVFIKINRNVQNLDSLSFKPHQNLLELLLSKQIKHFYTSGPWQGPWISIYTFSTRDKLKVLK